MQTEDLILVSVDDHIVEPPSLAEYLEGPRARRSTRSGSPASSAATTAPTRG